MRNKLFIIGLALLLLASPLISSANWYDYPSLETNLEAYYNFSETSGNLTDNTGNYNLDYFDMGGGFPINYSQSGISGNSMFFPNEVTAGDVFYMSTYPSINFDFGNETFCAWVNFTDDDGGNTGGAVFFDEGTDNMQTVISHTTPTPNIRVYTGSTRTVPLTDYNISKNVWTHICITKELYPTGNTTLYVNGTFIGTQPTIDEAGFVTGVVIGWTDGFEDEYAVWSRQLNATEIDWVYQVGLSGNTREAPPTPPVCLVLTTGNYTISGGKIIANDSSEYIGEDVNVTYDYSYNQNTQAGNVIDDTTKSISGVTNWFPIIVVISAMIVLIILTVLILKAIKGSGMVTSA